MVTQFGHHLYRGPFSIAATASALFYSTTATHGGPSRILFAHRIDVGGLVPTLFKAAQVAHTGNFNGL